MRTINPLPVDQMTDADVIGLPITIEFTLRSVWNRRVPNTFPHITGNSLLNDPWFKWASENKSNYEELWNRGMDILEEHDLRFGSRAKPPYKHGSTAQMDRVGAIPPLPEGGLTRLPMSVDEAKLATMSEVQLTRPGLFVGTYTVRPKPDWMV